MVPPLVFHVQVNLATVHNFSCTRFVRCEENSKGCFEGCLGSRLACWRWLSARLVVFGQGGESGPFQPGQPFCGDSCSEEQISCCPRRRLRAAASEGSLTAVFFGLPLPVGFAARDSTGAGHGFEGGPFIQPLPFHQVLNLGTDRLDR
jgi:hypothetical protein